MELIVVKFNDWNALPDRVVLGYDGENRSRKLVLIPPDIEDKNYRLEIKGVGFYELEKEENTLTATILAEMLKEGDIEVQVVRVSQIVNEDGTVEPETHKSNVATWRVLNSVELSRDYEKQEPDALDRLLAAFGKQYPEFQYNEANRALEWRYVNEEEWTVLFSVDEVSEGASAYQIAVKNGYEGTEEEWLQSLHGKDGKDGRDGVDGKDGVNGSDGKDGVSATAEIVETENGTTVKITDVNGEKSFTVKNGVDGQDGKDGYTPQKGVDYFDGKDGNDGNDGYTPVKGKDYFDGENGKSVYELAVANGFEGTEEEYLASLHGKDGTDGKDGTNGKDGADYVITDADYQAIADMVIASYVDGDNMSF